MLINEVESKTGLSKKSIRYYEEVGLITPKRVGTNDYRTYTDNDITILQKIKFLRELDVSIHDLKKLANNELSLKECMNDRIVKIENYEKNYKLIKQMCQEISTSNLDYKNLNIDKYFTSMNILRHEGFIMNTTKKDHSKKIMGAITSSIIFIAFFTFLISMITYFQLTESDKMPIIIYIFFIGVLTIPMISIIINLIQRIKEIKGGEEDEASKY